jgi:hypothetical protein
MVGVSVTSRVMAPLVDSKATGWASRAAALKELLPAYFLGGATRSTRCLTR